MNISYRMTSFFLLAILLLVAFAGIFSGVSSFPSDKKDITDEAPFSFVGIAAQMTGDSLANTVRLRFSGGRLGESLVKWQLFNLWLQSRISINTYSLLSFNYHILFLMIILFYMIMVLWKHAKDGNKRYVLCK